MHSDVPNVLQASRPMRRRLLAAAAAGGLSCSQAGRATDALAARTPAQPGWSQTLALDAVLDEAVKARIVGVSALVARDGEIVYRRAAGMADREQGRPMAEDEAFRLASLTKPIVCAAALALADQGRLVLDDPIVRWLPDFWPRLPDGRAPTITVRHLLTHTAGLDYGFLEVPDGPYHRLGVSDGLDGSGLTLDQNLQRIAQAPLRFEPGTQWHYSVSIDVLGAVIERAAGKPLPVAVRDLVTGPLGMTDTVFTAAPGAALATPYGDGVPGPVRMTDPFSLMFADSPVVYSPGRAFDPGAFPSGGAGMVGTAPDYMRFLEAVRTGGAGILRPQTAAAMTRNQIGSLAVDLAGPGFGWGLGVAALRDAAVAGLPLPTGCWSWSGAYGCNFWVDPASRLSVVVLTNTAFAGMVGDFPLAVQRAVYGGNLV